MSAFPTQTSRLRSSDQFQRSPPWLRPCCRRAKSVEATAADNMPLDPHVKRLLDIVAAGKSDLSRLSPEAMRQAIEKLANLVDAKNVPVGAVEDREFPGPACRLPIRIYTPTMKTTGRPPALIYFHGGTGVFCSIETHD